MKNNDNVILTKTELRHLLSDFILFCKNQEYINDMIINHWIDKYIEKR